MVCDDGIFPAIGTLQIMCPRTGRLVSSGNGKSMFYIKHRVGMREI